MFKLFSFMVLASSLILLGCLDQIPQLGEKPSPTPTFSGLKEFAQTPEELNSLKLQALPADDAALLQANELFLVYADGVEKLNNFEFDCANSDLYQGNLDDLQASIDQGRNALPVISDSNKKDYWDGFFFGMQMQKDRFQGDLDELCG